MADHLPHTSADIEAIPTFAFAGVLSQHAGGAAGDSLHPRWPAIVTRWQHIGRDFEAASAGDEEWLGDLGLRPSPSPAEFFTRDALVLLARSGKLRAGLAALPHSDHSTRALAREAGIVLDAPAIDYDRLARRACERPLETAQLIRTWVDHFGSWDDAAELATRIAEFARRIPRTDAGARLLGACANVLAGRRDPRARDLYDLALAAWTHPIEQFFTALRGAVAEVKRLGNDPARVGPALDRAEEHAATLGADLQAALDSHPSRPEDAHLRPDDSRYALGLVQNLRALVAVKAKDFRAAGAAIEHAWSLLEQPITPSPGVPAEVVEEFRIQVLANRGLMTGMSRGWEDALEQFWLADSIAQRQPRIGFRVETLSLVGYALIQLEQFAHAVDVLLDAERFAALDAAPVRERHVWKLLAVALDGAGDPAGADARLAQFAATAA